MDTLTEAREIKCTRGAQARARRSGPTLHAFSLEWLDAYAGTGHDALRENTRREYRRLLTTFALEYFDAGVRVRDLDRRRVQGFVDWLTTRSGRGGRLKDSSIANIVTPLRLVLDAAVAHDLVPANPAEQIVLPRRRAGRAWAMQERRYLTRTQLKQLRTEIPGKWRPLFDLIAATGLRIPKRLHCAGATSRSTGPHRICTSVERSSRASSSRRSHATARARFRSRRAWRAIFRTPARPTRAMTRTSSPAVVARRRPRAACAGASSSQRPNALA